MTRFSEFDHLDQINIQSIPMKGIAYVQLAFMKWLVQSYQMPRHVASTHLPTKWIKVVFCLLLVDWVDHTWQKCSPFVSQARERMVSVLCQLALWRKICWIHGWRSQNQYSRYSVGLRRSQEFDQRCTGQDWRSASVCHKVPAEKALGLATWKNNDSHAKPCHDLSRI